MAEKIKRLPSLQLYQGVSQHDSEYLLLKSSNKTTSQKSQPPMKRLSRNFKKVLIELVSPSSYARSFIDTACDPLYVNYDSSLRVSFSSSKSKCIIEIINGTLEFAF